jgi:hypothetical protein
LAISMTHLANSQVGAIFTKMTAAIFAERFSQ